MISNNRDTVSIFHRFRVVFFFFFLLFNIHFRLYAEYSFYPVGTESEEKISISVKNETDDLYSFQLGLQKKLPAGYLYAGGNIRKNLTNIHFLIGYGLKPLPLIYFDAFLLPEIKGNPLPSSAGLYVRGGLKFQEPFLIPLKIEQNFYLSNYSTGAHHLETAFQAEIFHHYWFQLEAENKLRYNTGFQQIDYDLIFRPILMNTAGIGFGISGSAGPQIPLNKSFYQIRLDFCFKGYPLKEAPISVLTSHLFSADHHRISQIDVDYRLRSIDRQAPKVTLELSNRRISPNRDGIADRTILNITAEDQTEIREIQLITLFNGEEIHTNYLNFYSLKPIRGVQFYELRTNFVRMSYHWPHTVLPESVSNGTIRFQITSADSLGNRSTITSDKVSIDTVAPQVQGLITIDGEPGNAFSPNGDEIKDQVDFNLSYYGTKKNDRLNISLHGPQNTLIYSSNLQYPWVSSIRWNGLKDNRKPYPEGNYFYRIQTEDDYSNRSFYQSKTFYLSRLNTDAGLSVNPTVFSPNQDGRQDYAVFQISAATRKLLEKWTLTIADSASGTNIRQEGGFIPLRNSFYWNGKNNQKRIVPEGNYSAWLTLYYQDGNTVYSETNFIRIDNTPPEILRFETVSHQFSPNGDGLNDLYQWKSAISGYPEDLIEFSIQNAYHQTVWTNHYTLADLPDSHHWNGQNFYGENLPNGFYSLNLQASDQAGNMISSNISIVLFQEKDFADLSISRSNLSLISDKELLFYPDAGRKNQIQKWLLKITDSGGKTVQTFRGTHPLPEKISWRPLNPRKLQTGNYSASLRIEYPNKVTLHSPTNRFTLDHQAPIIQITASNLRGGKQSPVYFRHQLPELNENDLTASYKITDINGETVSEKHFPIRQFPAEFKWNEQNRFPDGRYAYQISSIDSFGNRYESSKIPFILALSPNQIQVHSDSTVFSPNQDGLLDRCRIYLSGNLAENNSVVLNIMDRNGKKIRKIYIPDISEEFYWDGTGENDAPPEEGLYTVQAESVTAYQETNLSPLLKIRIDNRPPQFSFLLTNRIFSPNYDGNNDILIFDLLPETPDDLTSVGLEVFSASGENRTDPVYQTRLPALEGSYFWDGTSSSGRTVEDGLYRLRFTGIDQASNQLTVESDEIRLDATTPDWKAEIPYLSFSPNQNGIRDNLIIRLKTPEEGIHFTWSVINEEGAVFHQSELSNVQDHLIQWNGYHLDRIRIPDGTYTLSIKARDSAGNRSETNLEPMTVDTAEPDINVSMPYSQFSPNNDQKKDFLIIQIRGQSSRKTVFTLTITDITGKTVRQFKWKETIPVNIIWNGLNQEGQLLQRGIYKGKLKAERVSGNYAEVALPEIFLE